MIARGACLDDGDIFQDDVVRRGFNGAAIVNVDAIARETRDSEVPQRDVATVCQVKRLLATREERWVVGVSPLYDDGPVFAAGNIAERVVAALASGRQGQRTAGR